MTATLTFNMPEESYSFDNAVKADKLYADLLEIEEIITKQEKNSTKIIEAYNKIKEIVRK